jgi:O-antigen ligase/Flp pilus assembly protein TadD
MAKVASGAAVPPVAAPIVSHPLRSRALALAPGALALGLAAANGGYFPTSWGWSGIAAAWSVVLALLLGRAGLTRLEAGFVGLLLLFTALTWASVAWAAVPSQAVLEGERGLVLPLAIAGVLLLVRRAALSTFAWGLLAAVGAVCFYSLATRLVPDRLGVFDPVAGYRLSTPIGYWNALGVFAAIGVVLALGLAARGSPRARAAAAATLLLPMLTLYFTFSRGAFIALGVGLTVALACDPRRLQLLGAGVLSMPAAAGAVFLASRSPALTHQTARLTAAAHEGHRLIAWLLALAAANAGLAWIIARLEPRLVTSAETRRNLNRLLAAGAAVAVVVAVAVVGGPVHLYHRAYDSFSGPPPHASGSLNARLLSFSGNGRLDLWRAAVHDWQAHPGFGSGAGSYEQFWLEHRPIGSKVRDAHNLYLETLAELGPPGLALLVPALAVPLAAVRRARRHPIAPALAGGYVAFLVHAGVDWDWEVLAVTVVGLSCAAGLLIAARADEPGPPSAPVRSGATAGALALAAVALIGLVGNIELARSARAARSGDWSTSAQHARRAHRWAPWSSQPWQALGEAQLSQGRPAAARASFRKAIGKDANDWSLWFDLARAGTGATQRSALARASQLDPRSPEIAELRQEIATQ